MTRVKKGTVRLKRRGNILSQVKGYRYGRSKKKRQAKEAIAHAGLHSFAHRRDKKGDFRRLWNVRINAAVRALGTNYSTIIHKLKDKNIALNRKMLSEIAREHPETFERIVKEAS
jgi:large subunit ribosomal protein L20